MNDFEDVSVDTKILKDGEYYYEAILKPNKCNLMYQGTGGLMICYKPEGHAEKCGEW